MRKQCLICGAVLSIFASTCFADQAALKAPMKEVQPSEQQTDQGQISAWMIETEHAAKDYVEGLDRGDYAPSWSKGDQLFQHTITQQEWAWALGEKRKKLGKVLSRTLKDQKPAWDPQGLPKGPYMVVEYNTSFEKAPKSGETLTLRRGTDGKWRVLTYQVD